MSDLVWYLLGYLDGKGENGRARSRCCCALGAILIVLLAAGGVISMASL